MTDDAEHWRRIARQAGIERDGRKLKQTAIARRLDWSDWTQEEREVYAAAFLFPAPVEPLINGITIDGKVLNMEALSRTARIIDASGDVWMVVEHAKPVKA